MRITQSNYDDYYDRRTGLTMAYHKLLERQIRKLLPESLAGDPALLAFFEAINSSYESFERDNQLNEHANRINEQEYIRINQLLLEEVDLRRDSIRELKEAIHSIRLEQAPDSRLDEEIHSESIKDTLSFLREQIRIRKQMEADLRLAQQDVQATANQLSRLIASLHHGILVENAERQIVLVNQRFCDLFNIPGGPQALIGMDCNELAHLGEATFKDGPHFSIRLEEILTNRTLLTGEDLELVDGRTFSRDYVPVFLDDQYQGNLWKYEDVTTIKEKERNLQLLSLVASASSDGILFTDGWGRITWANEGFYELTQFKPAETLGKTPIDLCQGPETDPLIVEQMIKAYQVGDSFEIETPHYRKDGTWFWGKTKGQCIKNEAGGTLHYFARIEDVSARREQEEQIRILSLIAEENNGAVIMTDKCGNITWVNNGFTNVTGYSLEEVLGQQPGKMLQGPGTDPQTVAYLRERIGTQSDFHCEILNYTKLGEPYWVRISGQPLFGVNGQLTGFFAIEEDITEQRRREEAFHRLSIVASSNQDGVAILDTDDTFTWVNDSYERITGYSRDELMGRNPTIFMFGKLSDPKVIERMKANAKARKSFREEFIQYRKDGTWYWARLSMQYVLDENGKDIERFAVLEDITDEKEREWQFERLSLVASANPAGVMIFDDDNCLTWVNNSYERITGYTREELIGRNPTTFMLGPQTQVETKLSMDDLIASKTSFKQELIQYKKDGTAYWARLNMQFVPSTTRNGIGHFAVLEDISQEKDRELQFERLSLVASANNKGVAIFDPNETYAWVNTAFEQLTGYTADDLLGYEHINRFIGPETDPLVRQRIVEHLIKQEGFTEELYFYRKDGTAFWARLNRQFIFDDNGKLVQKFSILEDISEQREIQLRLKESEDRFRVSLQKIGDNVWEHNFATGETWFSKEENDLLGYSTNDYKLNDSLWWSSIYPPDVAMLKENDLKTRAGDIDHHTLEYRMVHRDGSLRWVLDRGVVIERNPDGTPARMIGTHTDITGIKHTELELEQRVRQFRSLAENTPGVIVEYEYHKDGTEGYRYISPSVERIIGLSPEEFVRHDSFVHPDDRALNREKNRHSRDTLEPFYNEARLIIPGRGTIWTSVTASFSYWTEEGGKVFTGFIMDITQKKLTEQLLRKEEEKYRSIIANMNLGLLEVNLDDEIIFANQSFCDMSGYDLDELTGCKAADLFVISNGRDVVREKLNRRMEGHSDAYEIMIRNKRGEAKWWLISGAPRFDDEGKLVGSIGIHLDITEQKQLEHELILAREQAEASSKAKEAFLANMSHEIRTPMNAILGMASQLAKTGLSTQQRFFLENISAASENLMIIINDILDLSKIEAGKLSLEYIGFEPKTVMARVIQVLNHRAEEKGLRLTNTHCDNRLSPVLIGDPYRLNQVLLNLASNSIKFTQKGSIDLSCNVIEDSPRRQKVHIVVRDTGIGMDAEFVKNIFEKFTQEDASVTRKYGGTGLGMSISKDLVSLMGGEIFVSSEKGVGTVMTVEIVFEKGTTKDLPYTESFTFDPKRLVGKKVLVVDDNDINRLVASTILRNYSMDIREAVNGLDAVQKIQETLPDLVLMDIQMPEMDGIEATRVIRKEISEELPLVALTANALKGDNERYLEAGMNDYLSKPFKEEELLRIVSTWVGKMQGAATATQPSETLTENIKSLPTMNKRYSLSKLEEISRGNQVFMEKMLSLFLEQVPPAVKEIRASFSADNLEQVQALSHRLKPTLDNLCVEELRNEIRELEQLAKDRERNERMDELIGLLEDVIGSVAESIQEDLSAIKTNS